MKRTKICVILLALLMVAPLPMTAKTYRSGGQRWSSTMNGRGLYGRGLKISQHTIAVSFSGNYYSGDVELPGNIFNGFNDGSDFTIVGDNAALNQMGAAVAFSYTYRQNNFVAYRVQMKGGKLRGKCSFDRPHVNSAGVESTAQFRREFSSFFTEYSVGIEFYPIPVAGLYLYAGVGGTTSFITRNFNNYLGDGLGLKDNKVTCTVPMIPVGIGYKWDINSFQLGIEASWHPALIDIPGANLDGWESGYNAGDGIIRYPLVKSTNKFNDSFVEVSISFGYRLPLL